MRICVYAGSSVGRRPAYAEAAKALGDALAREGIGLVYGGGSIGLMGIVADAVLKGGGEVVGVITTALDAAGLSHAKLTELRIVPTMHDRKAAMAEAADAFIALPGGIGTLEELFEVWTWSQLGVHAKPIAFLNTEGFYDGLCSFLDHVVEERFLKPIHRGFLTLADDPQTLLSAIRAAEVPYVPKWLEAHARDEKTAQD